MVQFVPSVLACNSAKTGIYWAREHNYPSVLEINDNFKALLFFLHPTHSFKKKIIHHG